MELVAEVRRGGMVGCYVRHREYFAEAWGFDAMFDVRFLLHEVGLVKPEAAILEHVALCWGVCNRDLVLLDDDRANVDAVRSAGWIAQQVRRPQEARAALVHLGVLPSSR